MNSKNIDTIIPQEVIVSKIYLIREQKVMIDRDLAELYGVETRVLNQAVKRNIKRFPIDFMFQMTTEELKNWKSQIVQIENNITRFFKKFLLKKCPALTLTLTLIIPPSVYCIRAANSNPFCFSFVIFGLLLTLKLYHNGNISKRKEPICSTGNPFSNMDDIFIINHK
jgi:transcriptional regulator with XRE-family HTH domain